jgi:dTDP-4-dehydrorhamnose reductase
MGNKEMGNIVVFGAGGQLGQCFKNLAEEQGLTTIYFPSKNEANILDNDLLENVFAKYKPAYAINCAAYTAVDNAEDDTEAAFKLNKTGVENLSRHCLKNGTTLFHISTDFVFKGDKSTPLNETDSTEPIGVYGQTKLQGEKAIENILTKYFIIRTSWLYSEFGNNFVKTMLRLAADRTELRIIADQAGTPTYAIDLAACILHIIESKKEAYGIFHYSNEGIASWYDFAKAIFQISATAINVLPIKTEDYKTKASRPAYSVLDKTKIKRVFEMEIPYWRDSLVTCIDKLKNK